MKNNRVFIIEQAREAGDLSTLEEYGTVVVLFPPSKRRPPVFKPGEYMQEVVDALEALGYDPNYDAFALTRSLLPNVLFCAAVVSAWPNSRVLMFDAKADGYIERGLIRPAQRHA